MRSALVSLVAATAFFVGAFELGAGGDERPLPGRIDAGEARSAGDGAPPSTFLFGIGSFEIVPSAIRERPVADYETAPTETAAVARERKSESVARKQSETATPNPEPTPTPSETPSPSPTPTPSPSQSPVV